MRVLAPVSNIRPQTLHGERLKCVSLPCIIALNIHVSDLFPVECLGANIWNGSQHSQKITGGGTLPNKPSPVVSDRRVHSNTLKSGCHYFQWFNRGFYRQIRTLRISDLRNLLYDPMTDTYLKENWNSKISESLYTESTHWTIPPRMHIEHGRVLWCPIVHSREKSKIWHTEHTLGFAQWTMHGVSTLDTYWCPVVHFNHRFSTLNMPPGKHLEQCTESAHWAHTGALVSWCFIVNYNATESAHWTYNSVLVLQLGTRNIRQRSRTGHNIWHTRQSY